MASTSMLLKSLQQCTRSMATAAPKKAAKAGAKAAAKAPTPPPTPAPPPVPKYPFSKAALTPSPPSKPPVPPLYQGKGLMQYLARTLPTAEKQKLFQTYFSKQHPDRITPGTVLTVTLNHAPTIFSGVVINIRRRGMDTSFVLRNVVNRTGVEMQFYVNSPHVKDITILQRPKGRGMRRAKLFYLRDAPEKMTAISADVRV